MNFFKPLKITYQQLPLLAYITTSKNILTILKFYYIDNYESQLFLTNEIISIQISTCNYNFLRTYSFEVIVKMFLISIAVDATRLQINFAIAMTIYLPFRDNSYMPVKIRGAIIDGSRITMVCIYCRDCSIGVYSLVCRRNS